MRVHLVTVGASIAANFAKYAQKGAFSRVLGDDAQLDKRAHSGDAVYKGAFAYLEADPFTASAELNAMQVFLKNGEVDVAYLYHTSTGTGRFSARLLMNFLRKRGITAHSVEVKGFGVDFEDGLTNLLDKTVQKITELRQRGDEVYINATGGFKPESAMLVLAASLLGVHHVYYLHENFKKAEELPIFPLEISGQHHECLRWILEEERHQGFATGRTATTKFTGETLEDLEKRHLIVDEDGRVRLRGWARAVLRATYQHKGGIEEKRARKTGD